MRIATLVLLTMSVSFCHAQSDSIPKKKVYHYLGIQANELIRQVFNLSGNTGVVVNPYLFNYSINSARTGWGFNLGLGYTINNLDQSDPNNTRKTEANNFSLRVGGERKVAISKKWMLSYGLDLLADRNTTKTTTGTQFQGNISSTVTEATTKSSGLGSRLTLNYLLTAKIIVGTECTYYYKAITTNSTVTNTFNGAANTTETTATTKQLQFAVPAVLFLILKF